MMKIIRIGLACSVALTVMTLGGVSPAAQKMNSVVPHIGEPNDFVAGAWQLYKSFFMTPDGRIVDRENGSISHSEGQGYGMLIAVAADDRESFDRLWDWTEANLQSRTDSLAAWKWDPSASPHIADDNNATDGDILIAWALLRAYRRWNVYDHYREAEAIVGDIVAKATATTAIGHVILPGATGFAADDRKDGPVVNLSYWVFPALTELGRSFPALEHLKLVESGSALLSDISKSPEGIPTDWTSLAGDQPHPAAGFPDQFGYNAVRIPLYLLWNGSTDRKVLNTLREPFESPKSDGSPAVIEVATGTRLEALRDPGYRAIGAAIACSLGEEGPSSVGTDFELTTYYASTLHILTMMALSERYPKCF